MSPCALVAVQRTSPSTTARIEGLKLWAVCPDFLLTVKHSRATMESSIRVPGCAHRLTPRFGLGPSSQIHRSLINPLWQSPERVFCGLGAFRRRWADFAPVPPVRGKGNKTGAGRQPLKSPICGLVEGSHRAAVYTTSQRIFPIELLSSYRTRHSAGHVFRRASRRGPWVTDRLSLKGGS